MGIFLLYSYLKFYLYLFHSYELACFELRLIIWVFKSPGKLWFGDLKPKYNQLLVWDGSINIFAKFDKFRQPVVDHAVFEDIYSHRILD
jgi:hypothetical protein